MLSLKAKIRNKFGKQVKSLRAKGWIPAILYGDNIENIPLQVSQKGFERVFEEIGEASLVKLIIEDYHKLQKKPSKISHSKLGQNASETKMPVSKEVEVLLHDVARDPLRDKITHIDFYHPSLNKEIETEINLVFKGEPPLLKHSKGTLVKELQEVSVKGLVQNLPKEIIVDLSKLKSFDDRILIKDLEVSKGVTILRNKGDIVAQVLPPEAEEVPEEKKEEEKPSEESQKTTEKTTEKGNEKST